MKFIEEVDLKYFHHFNRNYKNNRYMNYFDCGNYRIYMYILNTYTFCQPYLGNSMSCNFIIYLKDNTLLCKMVGFSEIIVRQLTELQSL